MPKTRSVAVMLALALLAAGGGYLARAAGRGDAPQGVSANQWFAISDTLGVVIDDPVAAREQTERVAKRGGADRLYLDSIEGHFLAKVDGVWVTLNLQGPSSSALPAH
jgi:hypothetical protein